MDVKTLTDNFNNFVVAHNLLQPILPEESVEQFHLAIRYLMVYKEIWIQPLPRLDELKKNVRAKLIEFNQKCYEWAAPAYRFLYPLEGDLPCPDQVVWSGVPSGPRLTTPASPPQIFYTPAVPVAPLATPKVVPAIAAVPVAPIAPTTVFQGVTTAPSEYYTPLQSTPAVIAPANWRENFAMVRV